MDIKNGVLVATAVLSASLLSACGGGSGSSDSQSSLPDFELPSPAAGVSGNNPVGLWVSTSKVTGSRTTANRQLNGSLVSFDPQKDFSSQNISFEGVEKTYFVISETDGRYLHGCDIYDAFDYSNGILTHTRNDSGVEDGIRDTSQYRVVLQIDDGRLSGQSSWKTAEENDIGYHDSFERLKTIDAIKISDTPSMTALSKFNALIVHDDQIIDTKTMNVGYEVGCLKISAAKAVGTRNSQPFSGYFEDLTIEYSDFELGYYKNNESGFGNSTEYSVYADVYSPSLDFPYLQIDCFKKDCSNSFELSDSKSTLNFTGGIDDGSEVITVDISVEI